MPYVVGFLLLLCSMVHLRLEVVVHFVDTGSVIVDYHGFKHSFHKSNLKTISI
jgi:hypothetical protein